MDTSLTLSDIESMIYVIRGQKVMLDNELAELYGVETKRLNEQVKRNIDRFPHDFMFELTYEEVKELDKNKKIQGHGGKRKLPYAFTENGVAMLSSVLNSPKAIQVNISIIRIFTKLRSFLFLENQLNNRMDKLEENTSRLFKLVFQKLDAVEASTVPYLPKKRQKIGLKQE